jgi:lactoylglutathione lyase
MAQPQRPHLTGLSHIALFVHDIEKSRRFYKDFLGFDEPYFVTNQDGSLHLTWIKINDRQTIELFPEKTTASDRLNHIAFETDDAAGLRVYLASRGVKAPAKVDKGRIGNLNFNVTDPDGHTVELVQYAQDGWTVREKGRFMPETRISERMSHVGVLVSDLEAALKFYGGILGGTETWRGGSNPNQLSWVNVKVPDGPDYVEFMLYSEWPPPDKRGRQHHLCLEVADVEKAKAVLEQRATRINYTRPLQVATGINRKRQLNLWDPDGTRVELMEPRTVDGAPAPSSTAPPPKVELNPKPAPAPFYVGLRRSSYGLRQQNRDDAFWLERTKSFAAQFPDSQPLILEIVSNYQDDGSTEIEFPKPAGYERPTEYMTFRRPSPLDHERALAACDAAGVKVILQFEPGNADVGDCFKLARLAFGQHLCVVGLAIDAEWFRTSKSPDKTGVPISDAEAQGWMTEVQSFNPDWVLVLKHFEVSHLPGVYRHPHLWLLTDSQEFHSQQEWLAEMNQWATTFNGGPLGAQYGYPKDRNWWARDSWPPVHLGQELLKRCPGFRMLLWVDFTADRVEFLPK